MAFFSDGSPGADPCGTRRSGVDIAAGLTDFSRACLAAVVSISNVRPGGSTSAAFSSHILGLLSAERRFALVHTKGMSYGSGRRHFGVVISRTPSCMRALQRFWLGAGREAILGAPRASWN